LLINAQESAFRQWPGIILPQHEIAITRGSGTWGASIMTSVGSFASFFVGLFVGEVTLFLFLALVRQDSVVDIAESPPLAAGQEARESVAVEPA
jgi:hypothetical protein